MTPVLEVGHVRVGLSVKIDVVVHFAVVEEVGDDGTDLSTLNTGGNVLAISSATSGASILSVFNTDNEESF